MTFLISQEIYKLTKRRSFLVFWVLLIAFQVLIAFYGHRYPAIVSGKDLFMDDFYAPSLIVFYTIGVGSTMLSSEIQSGTLKGLLYRQFTATQILISKWITLLLSVLTFYVSTLAVTWILKLVFFGNEVSLTRSFLKTWAQTNLSSILTLIFLLSFVALLGTLFEGSTAAITVGIVTYFIVSIFNQLMFMIINSHEWLKWNPINMMNLGNQLQTPRLSELTHLNLPEIAIGYLAYATVFLILGTVIFKRRQLR